MFNNSIQDQNNRRERASPTNAPSKPNETLNQQINNSKSNFENILTKKIDDIHQYDENDEFIWLKLADKGTFGTVYKVKEIATGKVFAIKRVFQDPQYVNNEYQILKDLDHKNCIKTYRGYYTKDKHTEKVFLNIVMDYVPLTLYHIIQFYKKRELQFPALIAKVYAYQQFRALLYLERKSIVHRDLKPKNILIDPKNHQLILADFGSAKVMQNDIKGISYICTRYYRAPELLLGDETYRHKIDMWATGCVIAEMILGDPLFMGKNSNDQLLQIIKVLGTPSKDYIEVLLKKRDINLPCYKGLGLLRKLEGFDPLLQDLLIKTLQYDPDVRISPLEALLHSYFDELRVHQISINDKEIVDLFDFTLEELDNDKEMYKKLVPDWYVNQKIQSNHT